MSAQLWLMLLSAGAHCALGALMLGFAQATPTRKNKEAITLTLASPSQKIEAMDPVLPSIAAVQNANAALKQAVQRTILPPAQDFFSRSPEESHLAASDAPPLGEVAESPRPKPQLVNGDAVHVTYPPKARHLKVEGSVHLRLTIAESGEVKKAVVLSGPAFCLHQAAMNLARKLQFLPAQDEQGNAVVSEVTHEVIFSLK